MVADNPAVNAWQNSTFSTLAISFVLPVSDIYSVVETPLCRTIDTCVRQAQATAQLLRAEHGR